MGILQEVWLFTWGGNAVAEFCQEKCIGEDDIPNFVKEVKEFIQLLDGVVDTFDFGDRRIKFSPCLGNYFYIVIISPNTEKDKKIKKLANNIVSLINGLYEPNQFIDWDGDISIFELFKKKLDTYIKMSDF